MVDTIILLTGAAEQEVLTTLLKRHNARLTVHLVDTLDALDAIEPQLLRRARLLAFLTSVIVPQRILERLGFGAYNFHPGPPDYPGWVPSHFAVYDRATAFGTTAHVMTEQVDSGPIVGIELFDIPPGTGVFDLEKLAFTAAAWLIWRVAPALATQREPLEPLPITWCRRRSTRRLYEAMCDIPADISAEELERRIYAFGAGHFGIHPTVTVNGRKFRYTE